MRRCAVAVLVTVGCGSSWNRTSPDYVRGFAVTDRYLVVAQHADGRIVRLRKSDASVLVLASDQHAFSVGVNRTHAYWVASENVLRRVAIDGGPVQDLATLADFYSVAVDDSGPYWADGKHIMHVDANGRVVEMAKAHADLGVLAFDDAAIYWVDSCAGAVFSLAKSGGEPRQLSLYPRDQDTCENEEPGPIRCQYMCEFLAVDEASVYWPEEERIMRVAKHGGRPEIVLHGKVVTSIAVDDDTIYFVAQRPFANEMWSHSGFPIADVMALRKHVVDARPIMVEEHAGNAQGLAVASKHVYWRSAWIHTRRVR